MDRKIPFILLTIVVIIFSATSCGTLEVGIEKTRLPDLPLTATVEKLITDNAKLETEIAAPSPTQPIFPTVTQPGKPTKTPITIASETPGTPQVSATPTVPTGPRFSNVRFSTQPDAAVSQRFYVEGTTRVYAIWNYSDMKVGLIVRRVWYLNGIEWIVREEPWDFTRYGSDGTIRDVSIFEEEIGMQAGEYALTIFIDGVPQDLGQGTIFQERASFWIFESDIRASIASPNKYYTAIVNRGGHLLIEDPNGKLRELVITQEISDLAWFPDNRHIVFTDRDRTKQVNEVENIGIAHKLWVLDIDTGERHLIGTTDENFHSPLISPGGRFVAVLAGPTYKEACQASPTLAVLELDTEFRRQAVYVIDDFSGFTYSEPGRYLIYPFNTTTPGNWDSETRLIISLWWSCLDVPQKPDGVYLLDLERKSAKRIGVL